MTTQISNPILPQPHKEQDVDREPSFVILVTKNRPRVQNSCLESIGNLVVLRVSFLRAAFLD